MLVGDLYFLLYSCVKFKALKIEAHSWDSAANLSQLHLIENRVLPESGAFIMSTFCSLSLNIEVRQGV